MDKLLAFLRIIGQLPKRVVGGIIGVLVWLLIEIVGFLPTVLLLVLVVIGYSLGRVLDGRDDWLKVIDRLWQGDRLDP